MTVASRLEEIIIELIVKASFWESVPLSNCPEEDIWVKLTFADGLGMIALLSYVCDWRVLTVNAWTDVALNNDPEISDRAMRCVWYVVMEFGMENNLSDS